MSCYLRGYPGVICSYNDRNLCLRPPIVSRRMETVGTHLWSNHWYLFIKSALVRGEDAILGYTYDP